MKKILLLAITILSINSVFGQTQRTVFVEEFTQASCPPCETTTPALNAIMQTNIEKVVQLRYHTSWPGIDPMNADNPTEVQQRVDYYGVTGVPNLLLDGVDTGVPGTASQAQIDAAYGVASPVSMTVTHTLSDDLSTATVTVEITNEGADAYSVSTNRLRVALMEEEVVWDAPPGSTSLTVFEAVMKTFVTGTAGMMIPEIAPGETWTNTWEDVAIPARIYNYKKLGVVAFIQDDATRKVAQSSHSAAIELENYPDLSVDNNSTVSPDLCDYAYAGVAEVANSGDGVANGFSANLFINGTAVQTIEYTDDLMPGASVEVTFDEVELPAGTSFIGYAITLNQGDLSTTNNVSDVTVVGKAGGIVESIDRDYENEEVLAVAEGTIIDVPFALLNFTVVSQDILGGSAALGGYGQSSNSLSVNFWNWNPASAPASGYMIIADQYVAPENLEMSFDYAYTSWAGSNDRLIVEVSTDCGASFTPVFNKAGSSLATAPELNANNARFLPKADEWATATADLSEYAGETLLVRFRVVSAWGDMLYIDNITLASITDVNELEANESLNVYPVPAQTYTNVELNTPNASNVQLRVLDMAGRVVASENLGSVNGRLNYALDVTNIPNGSYLISLNVDGREVVKRLSVVH